MTVVVADLNTSQTNAVLAIADEVKLAAVNRAALHVSPAFSRFSTHPLSVCWAQLYALGVVPRRRPLRRHPVMDIDGDRFQESDVDFATYLHEAFSIA